MGFRLFLLFGLCGLVFASSEKCPLGATASDDGQRCFHLLPFKADFVLAEQTCRLFGGHLVSIPDPGDNRLVHYLLATQEYFDPSIAQLWIGGSKLENLEAWKWSSGAAFNFSNGFVDHTTSMLGFNCLSLKNEGAEAIWVPARCCEQQAFVCETKISEEDARPEPECPVCPTAPLPTEAVPTTTEDPHSLLCKPGWTYNEQTKSCYRAFANEAKDHWESEWFCNQEGGLLTSIHSAEENSFVALLAKTVSTSEKRVWLGARYDRFPQTFVWRDNTKLDYTNWAPNLKFKSNDGMMMVIEEKSDLWYNAPRTSNATETSKPTIVCKSPIETPFHSCTTGWTKFGDFDYCAMPNQTWVKGELTCVKEGGHLVSIHSEEENTFVSSLAATGGFSQNIWLGAVFAEPGGGANAQFTWTDGTPHDYHRFVMDGAAYSYGVLRMAKKNIREAEWDNWKSPTEELTIVCKKPID